MKFIAHRGYSGRYPENSLAAFRAVIDHPGCGRSITGIELDIHLTADGRIPVIHETTVGGRLRRQVPVARCTFDRLQRLFRKQHGGKRPEVPDIGSVLSLVNHRTGLCFEIKQGPYDLDRFGRCFADALQGYHSWDDVIVSSFSYDILESVRPHLAFTGIRYGFIFDSVAALEAVPAEIRERFDLLHPWYRLLIETPEQFPAGGPPILCWTVNDPSTVRALIELSATLPIAAVMTDDLDLAEQFRETA